MLGFYEERRFLFSELNGNSLCVELEVASSGGKLTPSLSLTLKVAMTSPITLARSRLLVSKVLS